MPFDRTTLSASVTVSSSAPSVLLSHPAALSAILDGPRSGEETCHGKMLISRRTSPSRASRFGHQPTDRL